ncbi:MAG: kinase anchor protein [Candidatus Nanohaloarchaea archaeon]|nr:kinase anchor protein [Candidatus Nanohaloarchaea archaeon]
MENLEEYIDQANEELECYREGPKSLREYMQEVSENPKIASQAAKYIVEAIESFGTREVIESGEKLQRYRFFDDPANDGEHAILGNTEELNNLVEDLRNMAGKRGKEEKILWINGSTSTGKSEVKRCFINGLKAYSKTEEGRRYTHGFNDGVENINKIGIGKDNEAKSGSWQYSPINDDPLKLLPEETRKEFISKINEDLGDSIKIDIEGQLDPFSRHYYEKLEEEYLSGNMDEEGLFEYLISENNVRIKRYLMDVGQGIGVLHSEDEGNASQKLVGNWMRSMIKSLNSKGEKDARAHSYNGIVAQGHRGLTIIEDASQHRQLVRHLLNVPEEKKVKLDRGTFMDVDTVLLMISNPDMEAFLEQKEDMGNADPLRHLRRRLKKHDLKYLTNYSTETNLIRRSLTNNKEVWNVENREELDKKIRAPLKIDSLQEGEHKEKELAPHSLEAAAIYEVITRIKNGMKIMDDSITDLVNDDGVDLIDKALLYDKGEIEKQGRILKIDQFEKPSESEGKTGIPVTYTKDRIAELVEKDTDRKWDNVILPQDILEQMAEGLEKAPIFSEREIKKYRELKDLALNYIEERQEEDVLNAIMKGEEVDEEVIEKYVKHVYANQLDTNKAGGEKINPKPEFMKEFEIDVLRKFDEDSYKGKIPTEEVEEFRKEDIFHKAVEQVEEMQKEQKNASINDINHSEIPALESILGKHSLKDVKKTYPGFKPHDWEKPIPGTHTEEVKEKTIENLQKHQDYSEESARAVAEKVVLENWNN